MLRGRGLAAERCARVRTSAATTAKLYLSMAAVIFGAIGVGMVTEWADLRGHVPPDAYRFAFGLLLVLQLPGVLLHFWRRRPARKRVECEPVTLIPEKDYEIGSLRSTR